MKPIYYLNPSSTSKYLHHFIFECDLACHNPFQTVAPWPSLITASIGMIKYCVGCLYKISPLGRHAGFHGCLHLNCKLLSRSSMPGRFICTLQILSLLFWIPTRHIRHLHHCSPKSPGLSLWKSLIYILCTLILQGGNVCNSHLHYITCPPDIKGINSAREVYQYKM